MILVIVIIGIIIAIILTLKDSIIIEDKDITHDIENDIQHESINSIKEVKEREDYYAIQDVLNLYYTNINYLEAKIEDLDVIDIESEKEKKEVVEEYTNTAINNLKNIIADECISSNKNEILNDFKQYKNTTYRVENMYYYNRDINTDIYYIKLRIDNEKDSNIIVKIDLYNETFSIYPEKYIKDKSINESNFSDIFVVDDIEYIKENETNKYEKHSISDQTMAQYYLYDYGNIILNNIELAYSKIDAEYKKVKFPNLESYKSYIRDSNKRYDLLELKRYSIKEYDDYEQFMCEDQYGNRYIFKDKSVMNYTLELDTYTLKNEEFIEKYNGETTANKALLNLDKFFEMLNMKDYTSAYNLLDEEFKKNYFNTQTDFENYIKQRTFKYNKVTYNRYSNKINSVHVYEVAITDKTEESDASYNFTFIVKLGEDINFTVSFDIT